MTAQRQMPPWLFHLIFYFSGAATLLLGSVLHILSAHWQLKDAQSGTLLGAQFIGLCTGAYMLLPDLRRALQMGCVIAVVGGGVLWFDYTHAVGRSEIDYLLAVAGFLVYGIGVGLMTTVVNLLMSARAVHEVARSSSLSLLNFTWSVGALSSPIIAGFFIAHIGLSWLFFLYPMCAFVLLLAVVAFSAPIRLYEKPLPKGADPSTQVVEQPSTPLPPFTLLVLGYFALIYFLYGGLEITLSGWLGTYAVRYAGLGPAAAAYASSVLWFWFALGRVLAAYLVHVFAERKVRMTGLLAAVVAAVALQGAHTVVGMEIYAGVIGVGLGPFFPITFARMMSLRPSMRRAGIASSVTGMGQASIPYLVGLLSTHVQSLRVAMWVPIGVAVFLVALTKPREETLIGVAV